MPMVVLGLVALAIIAVVGYITWLDHQETAIIPENSSVQVERSDVSSSSAEKVSSSKPEPTTESSKKRRSLRWHLQWRTMQRMRQR